jgi:hypothetical protein
LSGETAGLGRPRQAVRGSRSDRSLRQSA